MAPPRFRQIDFYKKMPSDLMEATLSGGALSIAATVIMCLLLLLELSSFLALQKQEVLVIDQGSQSDLLRISFNISFPALSCEFASVDVSDTLGKERLNLTKTVSKTPITHELDAAGPTVLEHPPLASDTPMYDPHHVWWDQVDITTPLDHNTFMQTLMRYPIVIVNFYAPWCHWCQLLEPAWEAATKAVHEKYPEATDGRIRFAKVDCTAEQKLCQEHFITGFPSIRVFRKAHDEITVEGRHEHEAYTGDRTKEALERFADSLVPSAGAPQRHDQLKAAPRTPGCNIAGFVMVKKVPGSLHFTAKAEGTSIEHGWLNLTHVVHRLSFGPKPGRQAVWALQRLHPLGLQKEWLDKLGGHQFWSWEPQMTHEHYLQVVRTSVEPLNVHPGTRFDAYEYISHDHSFVTEEGAPSARITYDLSPIQVVVREKPRHWYSFITKTCAVVGGVFTVAGILDAVLHSGLHAFSKKLELGKQG